eukprot:CAMPEP_0183476464 /NCGR_PEP_ID=MMETSP0370-20130417/166474_1 /TAXON_ID=268820 /ORGANISM="Peridinium aciculiferum, Strain PAER-2" /LENGTH=45 /DNA_ID= /DNA_START= /DNA_END= /DNA_ORIENTATION=
MRSALCFPRRSMSRSTASLVACAKRILFGSGSGQLSNNASLVTAL